MTEVGERLKTYLPDDEVGHTAAIGRWSIGDRPLMTLTLNTTEFTW